MTRTLRLVTTPVVVGAGLSLVLGGATYAAYRSGVAAATGGTATPVAADPLTLAAAGTVSTGLYPGGPGADVTVSITNPYDRPVTVTAAVADGPITAVPVSGRVCGTHDVSFQAPGGLPATVPASSTATVTFTGVAKMGMAAASGCQGATVTIPMKVTGRL